MEKESIFQLLSSLPTFETGFYPGYAETKPWYNKKNGERLRDIFLSLIGVLINDHLVNVLGPQLDCISITQCPQLGILVIINREHPSLKIHDLGDKVSTYSSKDPLS